MITHRKEEALMQAIAGKNLEATQNKRSQSQKPSTI